MSIEHCRLALGDYELNFGSPHDQPTLVPSRQLEPLLDVTRRFPGLSPTTASAPADTLASRQDISVAVHLHAYHLETVGELLHALQRSMDSCTLFISTDSHHKAGQLELLLSGHPWACQQRSQLRVTVNAGRNVVPLFVDLFDELRSFDVVLHLHTKQSQESTLGASWRESLLSSLLPGRSATLELMHSLARYPQLGLVLPPPPALLRPYLNWGENYALAQLLCRRHLPSRPLHHDAALVFPVGMMFWFRPAALDIAAAMVQDLGSPPLEPLAWDGTPLHAIERLLCHCCEASDYAWAYTGCASDSSNALPSAHQRPTLSVWESLPVHYAQAVSLLAAEQRNLLNENGRLLEQHAAIHHEMDVLQRHCKNVEHLARQTQTQSLREVELLRQRIEALQQSFSWRLTAPLRKTLDLIKR